MHHFTGKRHIQPVRKCILIILVVCCLADKAQQVDTSYLSGLKWRMVGPFRGGRVVGACGVTHQPNVFYMGVNNGGVWKTNDYGRTWQPIFDSENTGSIGDVEVAPSNPDVIYVGSGEGIQRPDLSVGNGIYRSGDAGKTWVNTGLHDGLQIGRLAVDPQNENRVFAAVLGHPYGPNAERGVFRTKDGGKNWEKVLYIDENTGAVQVEIDPTNSDIIYADMWAGRQGPWENGKWNGPNSGLYKSTDGGNTWKKISGGLPTTEQGLNRIGFCVCPANHSRLYATLEAKPGYAGFYRSDNAGETWTKLSDDERLYGRGEDFAEVRSDPKNADIVYDAGVVVWKSVDGGKNWVGWKGAPGGDDYHRLWINPQNTSTILLASDQGTGVTVNGGETWSSWYNQPTAQLYHVSADNDFPYNLYSGQQESGSVGITSRGNDGQITIREWHPVSAEEYGYVVADPLDPNIVYGGKISRYDKRTGQAQDISPEAVRSGKYRFLRTAPILFSPIDSKTLYFAGNVLFQTTNGGNSWDVISPDLSRDTWDVPDNVGIYKTPEMKTMPRRGVIYTVAPSPVDANTIWAGTDDGLIHVTRDGGRSWNNVTPPEITSWSKVSIIDAGHSDKNTAYAAINRIRLDDLHPHIFRTHDGGKTWKEIVNGLADDPINVVREDPQRKGLLFAGSERMVYVSFNDGDNWQPLRLNMPCTSIRDLIIKDNDLAIATHGRSFWILDDFARLRQLDEQAMKNKVVLFEPSPAVRVRWDEYPDTPMPPDEPAASNPPDGAVIDYYLKDNEPGEVKLDILDAKGMPVRHYSSRDTLYKIPDVNIPLYWIRPQQILSPAAGAHRFVWDLHYQPLNVPADYPISAVYENTAPVSTSPWVMPGTYTVRLTVGGKIYTQTLEVRMDPRIKAPLSALQTQHDFSLALYKGWQEMQLALNQAKSVRMQIGKVDPGKDDKIKLVISDYSQKLDSILSGQHDGRAQNLETIQNDLTTVFNVLQAADVAPSQVCLSDEQKLELAEQRLFIQWQVLKQELADVNAQLKKAGMNPLSIGPE
jgi:photosystem II stability/assembly factor-like uncharacterized protein